MMSMYVMKSPGQFSEHIKSKTSKKQNKKVPKNTIVSFRYPSSKSPVTYLPRIVQVLSMTPTDLIGLELHPETLKWQYKKYKQSKMKDFQVSQLTVYMMESLE